MAAQISEDAESGPLPDRECLTSPTMTRPPRKELGEQDSMTAVSNTEHPKGLPGEPDVLLLGVTSCCSKAGAWKTLTETFERPLRAICEQRTRGPLGRFSPTLRAVAVKL